MKQIVLSILVENTPGVLSRVSGLFTRRGYNIDSITASPTQNEKFTRMTIAVSGDDMILLQIKNQLSKLEDVVKIFELKQNESVCRELILIKVRASKAEKQEIITIADIFRAKVVDVSSDTLMMELTGNVSKIEAFINLINDFEILELVRTGATGLTRGDTTVASF
ncbi:acetolactate synthase small subunit [Anaerostipes butyraticus]|uniref:Acetolactate synthase small subunit n=1 Tax=Anaerostipes butyraticus TaxID=645466 RepID=A0A916Q695_9FIRM|nr:acetolactate synthase small subunit [Anaerostipes butyraticus]GFO85189.1 acetolactate synthase small subunit [Anaerostipes butyraticus]HJC82334.1 acetolactate synthase small subunit [Candidatus Anaerostipes avicola]